MVDRLKTWLPGDQLEATDLDAEFDNLVSAINTLALGVVESIAGEITITLAGVDSTISLNIITKGNDSGLLVGPEGNNSTYISIGANGNGDRSASLSLIGDDTYTAWGMLLDRGAGANSFSGLYSRGTGGLTIWAWDQCEIDFFTNSVFRAAISATGEGIGIGSATFGANAANVLLIASSTAPTSSPSNAVQIFAVDVAGSHEARVRDEAGNTTTFSPHNFTLFDPDESHEIPWSYYSKNDYLGKEINVDMYGAIKALEEITGKQFIYTKDIPKRNWEDDQNENIDKHQEQIEKASKRLTELTEILSKTNDEIEKNKISQQINAIRIPDPIEPKTMPKWMKKLYNKKHVN